MDDCAEDRRQAAAPAGEDVVNELAVCTVALLREKWTGPPRQHEHGSIDGRFRPEGPAGHPAMQRELDPRPPPMIMDAPRHQR
jgi:hypothetical protein